MLTNHWNHIYQDKNLVFTKKSISLHAMISSCGYQKEETAAYKWHGLRRGSSEFCLFQYTISGIGALNYEGVLHEVGPGQAMILHFPHNHQYRLPPNSKFWEFFYLCLYGSEINRVWREIEKEIGPLVSIPEGSGIMALAVEILNHAFSGSLTSPFVASQYAYALAMRISREFTEIPGVMEKTLPLERIESFCLENIHRQIAIDEMAGLSGYSKYHFTRLFEAETGASPGVFLSNLRIQTAGKLLKDTHLTIKEIAGRCGFYDATYFCKTFRKAMGATPLAFRKSGMYR
jgi:AraC-like DNA-binding protein